MYPSTRRVTRTLLDMIADGLLDTEQVVLACLNYMSEDDVSDMAFANEFIQEPDEGDIGDTDEKAVKNMLLTLMLEHRIGDHYLPEGSIVFGRSNTHIEPCPCEICAAHG